TGTATGLATGTATFTGTGFGTPTGTGTPTGAGTGTPTGAGTGTPTPTGTGTWFASVSTLITDFVVGSGKLAMSPHWSAELAASEDGGAQKSLSARAIEPTGKSRPTPIPPKRVRIAEIRGMSPPIIELHHRSR